MFPRHRKPTEGRPDRAIRCGSMGPRGSCRSPSGSWAQTFTQRDHGDTPLHAAAISGHIKTLKRLLKAPDAGKCLEHKNKWGNTPLWLAVTHSHLESAQTLLEEGASLHVANNTGVTVIHVAIRVGLYDFLKEHLSKLRRDDFETRNSWDETPLQAARAQKKPEFVDLLTSHLDQA